MSHAEDYLRLTHEVLRRRWKEGSLPDEEEGRYAERLDDLWTKMSAPERHDYELWGRANRLHGVVFKDPSGWVARLLGHDFCGMSEVRRGALANLLLAVETEVARARDAKEDPFEDDRPADGDFIDRAVGRLINPTRKHERDELLLVECEGVRETWTLYVADIE